MTNHAAYWAVLALLLLNSAPATAVTLELRNVDSEGVGLNDPNPVEPIGGNDGDTRGEQRWRAVEYAADVWAAELEGDDVVRIDVSFAPVSPCQLGGSADAAEWVLDEPGLQPGVLYPVALAEHLLRRELNADDADIVLQLNAEPCADAPRWYYGLDGKSPPAHVNVVTAVLHEIAHGLGLSSTVNAVTGETAVEGALDVFSRNIYDTAISKAWGEMSSRELAISVKRQRSLVWQGPEVVAIAGRRLDLGAPFIELEPHDPAFTALVAEADAPPWLDLSSTQRLRLASPATACEPQPNNGIPNIMLAATGDCSIFDKAQHAAEGGAVALLISADEATRPPPSLRTEDHQRALPLPVLVVTQADAELLAAGTGVSVTLGVGLGRLLGADELGRPYIHVAEPALQGSNLSHWDSLARPSLLLEATVGADVPYLELELEKAALRDIGWQTTPCRECNATPSADAGVHPPSGDAPDAGTVDAGGNEPAVGPGPPAASALEAGGGQAPVEMADPATSTRDENADAAFYRGSAEAGADASTASGAAARRVPDDAASGCSCFFTRRPPRHFDALCLVVLTACAIRITRRRALAPALT